MSEKPVSSPEDTGATYHQNINDSPHDAVSENESINEYQGFGGAASDEVQQLARTFTRESFGEGANHELLRVPTSSSALALKKYLTNMSQVPGVSPFDNPNIDALDPDSDDFDAKLWVKNMRKVMDSDPEYYKPYKMGIAYKDLRAYGIASDFDYQATVFNAPLKVTTDIIRSLRKPDESVYFDILKHMDAIMRPGELTVVLGRPGSGCSTLLKTIAAHTYGFHIGEESKISYDGMTMKDIENHHRGDVIYSAETDVHFPHLKVGDTLEFAATLRTPQNRGLGVDRQTYAKHMAAVYMATYGLLHTRYTNVGNDFVRGVSGGERKRVSIAEASLSGANLQCWDNATRGLDSATALEFIRALKTSAAILDVTPLIAIYQCSQDAYDLFDKACVLYEGRQIYFGRGDKAREFFVNMGWYCPQRQTTADFLTSLTNPAERIPRKGFEDSVPKSAEEFEQRWKLSPEYAALRKEIDEYFDEVSSGSKKDDYQNAHVARQSKHISPKSPYTVSFFMQVRAIMHRNWLRTKGDPSIMIVSVLLQAVMGLILSSVFYNLKSDTASFYYRGASIFFAVLFNAFSSLLEILALFEARSIVEKHKSYALYRPSADALASIISEIPSKLAMSTTFNFAIYFMVNLRRTPGNFFFYWMMVITCTFVMSHLFRSLGAVSTSLPGAMTPASVLLSAMVIFTGFVIPTPKMLGWSRWINYINPVGYVFESLMVNEFHNRQFECSAKVPVGPSYTNLSPDQEICSAVGSRPGLNFVNGTDYIKSAYNYSHGHKWRNFGIALGFVFFFLVVYISLTEFNKGSMQKGEIALYLRSTVRKRRKQLKKQQPNVQDIESGNVNEKINYEDVVEKEGASSSTSEDDRKDFKAGQNIFHWKDLTYQVKIKSEDRVILNHVDGWVKPGQLTALMGSSGAGKTTLLNCLSERVTTGVITDGVRMVNGHGLDSSFQRSIGYVQQQDLHLPTSTVREAFRFSAYLRQPNSVSKKEKDEYVEYIIDLLEMSSYADAMVGVAGEGLNVEQRKRLTIGVELVAKPKLLLFLDEPTSGLDSQTAWSICKLMRKLCDHGQAILCTIHQPSALLLQEFDRLLFLQKGGQTVYFGELGENFHTLINYFEKYGAHPCPKEANPAEWMLEVVGAAPGSKANQNYYEVWQNSTEYQDVRKELETMEVELSKLPVEQIPDAHKKYAAPIWKQFLIVLERVLIENWRSPLYIYSKILLVVSTSLFNGFSFFKADLSMQGMQNQMFAIFMFTIQYNTLVNQMMPIFVDQRDVYETREAPSRTFSWFTFMTAQIVSEIPLSILLGTVAFFCWYYPVGLYNNAIPTDQVNQRGVLMWLYIIFFYVYSISMGHLCISFNEIVDNAANLATMLFTMCLLFCGVLAGPDALPRFWIFMYRANPFSYWIQGILATGLANNKVTCAGYELLTVQPGSGQTCAEYLEAYQKTAGGTVVNGNATENCKFCPVASTNDFLASVNAPYNQRWRDFGIFVAFIGINIILAVAFYWLARVPKGNREKHSKKDQKNKEQKNKK